MKRHIWACLSMITAAPLTAQQTPPVVAKVAAPLTVLVCNSVWHDPVRGRDIPVRIRLPQTGGKVPVVLFSHGLGGSVEAGTAWARAWTAAGIAVIHLQHPGSDSAVWSTLPPGPARREALEAAANARQLLARVGDVRVAVDQIAAGVNSDGCDLSRIDASRIGIAGHSFGASTVQAIVGQRYQTQMGERNVGDPRLVAAIAFSPSPPRDVPGGTPGADAHVNARAFAGVTVPFLAVTGSRDASPLDPRMTPAARQLVFAALPGSQAYQLVLNDADHAILSGSDEGRSLHTPGADDPGIVRTTAAVTTLFWRATLLGDAAAAAALKAPPGGTVRAGDVWSVR